MLNTDLTNVFLPIKFYIFYIGPEPFLSCPGTVEASQVWFTELWNCSLVLYLVEAVKEGMQLYGKTALWEASFIKYTLYMEIQLNLWKTFEVII